MRFPFAVGLPALLAAGLSPAKAEDLCVLEPGILRFEDDYGCFDGPNRPTGFPGALKSFEFGTERNVHLSIGGEVRQRYEYTRNPGFGAAPQDDAGVWLQRYTLHGDLTIGPHVRLFGQLSSALEAGRADGPSPVDENTLAIPNAFADIKFPLGSGAGLTLRAGRQEMRFGSGRLIDAREGPNVRRSFNAWRAIFQSPDWQVNAIAGRPVSPRRGTFDDETDPEQSLWGIYATKHSERNLLGSFDIYYLGFEDKAGAFAQGTASERRHSIGTRFFGERNGWDWNWEAVYQFGSFGGGDISAWTLASETGFTFRNARWTPRIAISANIASGDKNASDGDLGTFNPLFPRGNYFSEAALLGPRNFINFHPYVSVHPSDAWSLTADLNLFWRLEAEDGVYAPSGQLIRGPSGSGERFVGSALSVSSNYLLADNLSFAAVYTHFFPGGFLRETGPAEDVDFFELTLQYKF
ncbi:alginate export family protein [Leisingera sp. D0M16]|uniref:alginate export family protein n=1 Tax=Leisingera coralii TaxID=3351347 RepID=UPI003B781807